MPKTKLGNWSVGLIAIFFFLLGVFYVLVYSGQRGGETFFSNLYLTVPMLIAAAAGVSAFFTGGVSIIRDKERALLVFLSTLMGLFVLLYTSAEILFPH